MTPVFNFSAGPAMLPEAVMKQAQQEFLDWQGTGMSVMEISHRSPEFLSIVREMKQNLRDLLNIPESHEILFLSGGAQAQFAGIPLNLAESSLKAAYAITGIWSEKAWKEGKRYVDANVVVHAESTGYCSIPAETEWNLPQDGDYFYFCDNETINGLEFLTPPNLAGLPWVCDMTSSLLTKPIDMAQYGLIVASSQKNLGAAGVTVVIIERSLLDRSPIPFTPTIWQYAVQAQNDSLYNTPNTYSWYLLNLVLKWVKAEGGVEEMDRRARLRSEKLYHYIDQSNFYHNMVDPKNRSRLNVPFDLPQTEWNSLFLQQANAAGLCYLQGHKLVGGMRASLYNAMPMAGVDRLLEVMEDFKKRYA